jgi:uncharacterized protein YoxC
MAFLDEVGKAIGKASQGISDVAQTVNSAAQETRDNIARERHEKQQKNEVERQEKQERLAEEARKCPKCGQPLSGISAVCPLCGYEVRNAKTSSSINELTKEINKLEQKRNTIADTISTKVSKRRNSPTDEKIASLISNFIVPNTKEDIFEFMILADGNMDVHFLAGKGKTTQVADIVINAWANKFTQTYQKAQISFGEDEDFKKIQNLYDKKMQEIESAKHFSLFRRK